MKSVDTIVVGAGLSGLTAARKLHGSGKSVIVLEASDRVGGKTYSKQLVKGGVVELGAAWINQHTHPEVTALTLEAGNSFYEQNVDGKSVAVPLSGRPNTYSFKDGQSPSADDADTKNFFHIVTRLSELAETVVLEDVLATPDAQFLDGHSVKSWAESEGGTENVVSMLDAVHGPLFGCSAAQLSMLYFLHYVKICGGWESLTSSDAAGAQYQRTRNGNQTMSTYLASLLPAVHLSQPVSKITRHDTHCVVETMTGETYTAATVILAMPTPLYAKIKFEPPLPLIQRKAVERSWMGYLAKCILVYSEPWWYTKHGYAGDCVRVPGYCSTLLDSSDGIYANGLDQRGLAPRQYSLTCFVAGDRGLAWSKLPAEERAAAIRTEVGEAFGDLQAAANTRDVVQMQWAEEPYIDGAPVSLYGPGQAACMAAQATPSHRLFFAGTDNAPRWKGYMEGAVIAGRLAAERVVSFLDQDEPSEGCDTGLSSLVKESLHISD